MKPIKAVLYIVLLLNLTACDYFTQNNVLDKALDSGQPYFSIVYNHAFAKRFSLDENNASVLSDNLQAMAVEINKVNNEYTCELHLYVDDKLDIYMPESGDYYYHKPWSEIFFVRDYNEIDFNITSYVWLNHMRMRFDARVEAEYQFTRTLSYNRVHHSFLPGLTIVTLNTHCKIFNETYYPADIWIQKQNVGDYLVGNDEYITDGIKHKNNNQRFPIPMALIEQIKPYITIAWRSNFDRL